VDDKPMERSEVVKLLQDHDITPTRQRIEIAAFLFQREQHLSAENILAEVNSSSHRVSRATVYNTMGLFTSKGLVREVLIDRDRVFYDSNNAQHHHIYNVDTGELSDIQDELVNVTGLPELSGDVQVIGTDVIIKVANK
jgi:Fur family iron response transcriptional regulator